MVDNNTLLATNKLTKPCYHFIFTLHPVKFVMLSSLLLVTVFVKCQMHKELCLLNYIYIYIKPQGAQPNVGLYLIKDRFMSLTCRCLQFLWCSSHVCHYQETTFKSILAACFLLSVVLPLICFQLWWHPF